MSEIDSPPMTTRSDVESLTAVHSPLGGTSAVRSAVVSADSTDSVLLSQIAARNETAFRLIVERHGAMVFAVALRTVRSHHAAEDVYQATFLVLARDHERIRRTSSLAAWLHGVTIRIARKALQRRQRQPMNNAQLEHAVGPSPVFDEISETFDQQALDEELARLPAGYRDPLVLHFLRGLTCEQTAVELCTTVGAIEGRLKRGKRELRLRLMRRGVSLGAVLTALHWSQNLAIAAQHTALPAIAVAGGMSTLSGTPFDAPMSAEALQLTREIAMWTTLKTIIATLVMLTVTVSVGTLGVLAQGDSGDPGTSVIDTTTSVREVPTTELLAQLPQLTDNAGAIPGGGIAQVTEESPSVGYPGGFEERVGPGGGGLGPGMGMQATEAAPAPVISVYSTGMESDNAKRIQDALDENIDFEFPSNPLSDVLMYVSTTLGIPIWLDEAGLEAEGIGGDSEVKLAISGVSLRSALNMALGNVGGVELTYIVEDEVLKITTKAKANELLETRIYDVRALQLDDPQTLVHILQHTTSGEWASNGGMGDLSYAKGSFIIRQTQQVHFEIEGLLNQLARGFQAGEDTPHWPAPEEALGGPGEAGGMGGVPQGGGFF